VITRLTFLLGAIPVKVRLGLARGAWWSLYPCSAYWRLGGNDPAIENALGKYAAHPGFVCWDIGAHHGIYSVGLARAVGPTGRVESFEPDPVSARRLRWHKRLNKLDHLHVHAVAASDRTGCVRLYQYDSFGSTTSHLPYPGETVDQVSSLSVAAVRLDEWVQAHQIRPPNFIKIDVEGHGFSVLRGMLETLALHQPVVLLAVHTPEERDEGTALLAGIGYTFEAAAPESADDIASRAFGELIFIPAPRR